MKSKRELRELISVGPAMLRDFELLRVGSVAQLARQNPERMYRNCVALPASTRILVCSTSSQQPLPRRENPLLPPEQCQWWYWSRQRKAASGKT